jgi:ABC-type anion transport system duplicated permease subunit
MKQQSCDLARAEAVKDDQWRRHAVDCPDCSEFLAVTEWMSTLAERTTIPRELPTAGFLLVKARILQKQTAAERAERPVYVMIVLAGILLAAVTLGLAAETETRVGTILIDAVSLISAFAGVIIFGTIMVAVVAAVTARILKLTKA